MELIFSEIDNINTQNSNNYKDYDTQIPNNSDNYWEQQSTQKQSQIKKKKVSFDDILSNMNIVVNKSGVLQFMSQPQQQYQEHEQEQEQYQEQEPSVKHSYIYNKYFKDYQNAVPQQQPQVRVPKTIEEYKQMLLEDKLRMIEQKKRIGEIKSTKLMFTSNPIYNINQQNTQVKASKNNLRTMSFR